MRSADASAVHSARGIALDAGGLQADVVGARVEVLAARPRAASALPCGTTASISRSDPPSAMSLLVEAVVEEVVRVVAQPEVQLGVRPRPRAAATRRRSSTTHAISGASKRAVPSRSAGRSGVGGRDKVRVRPERSLAREVEHLRAQRGQAATVGRDRIGRGVEPVEELPHRGQRLGVVAGRLGVADTDSEQHPSGKVAVELGEVAGHLRGIALPDVEDPGGRGQLVVASSSGRSAGSCWEPPSQNVPKPSCSTRRAASPACSWPNCRYEVQIPNWPRSMPCSFAHGAGLTADARWEYGAPVGNTDWGVCSCR